MSSIPRDRAKRSRAKALALYFDRDRGVVPKQAEIDMKNFHQVLQVMAEAGELHLPAPTPDRFVDFLERLELFF